MDVTYLNECAYMGQSVPGPDKQGDVSISVFCYLTLSFCYQYTKLKERVTAVKIAPIGKEEKSWRPKKTKDPDVGSYELRKS